jgi:predicted NAD/FAD-binding protein
VVIGGGIAGVSIAYELAAHRQVTVLETETSLATHSTGTDEPDVPACSTPPMSWTQQEPGPTS